MQRTGIQLAGHHPLTVTRVRALDRFQQSDRWV